jgi:hypothetical protein
MKPYVLSLLIAGFSRLKPAEQKALLAFLQSL